MPLNDTFEFACIIKTETDKAILVWCPDTDDSHWFPFSTVHEIHRYKDGTAKIVVDRWIAEKKGIIA